MRVAVLDGHENDAGAFVGMNLLHEFNDFILVFSARLEKHNDLVRLLDLIFPHKQRFGARHQIRAGDQTLLQQRQNRVLGLGLGREGHVA